jgi:hypothetical protein
MRCAEVEAALQISGVAAAAEEPPAGRFSPPLSRAGHPYPHPHPYQKEKKRKKSAAHK